MRQIIYFFILMISLFSYKHELSEEERDKLHQDSVSQQVLAMGMNADSSFSFNRYNEELYKKNRKDSLLPELPFYFSNYQFLFYNDTLTYYYYNEFPFDRICGTGYIEAEENEIIIEEHKISKKDLIPISSDTLGDFIKKIPKMRNDNRFSTSIILAINKDSIKNKELQKLRKYLINSEFRYTFRPLSTRERLVADAKFRNTSEDFSKINWDSAYHTDFKKFYPKY